MSGDKALLLVLDLRKKEEDSALEMWTDAKNAVINFERQIEQLKQFEKIYENEMTVKSKNGMDMNMYMSYQQFLSKLDKIKFRQEAGLIQLQNQEERAKQNYLDKQKRRKIIESLLEKHKQERLLKEAKAELKSFLWRATHSRIHVFKELAYKIRRHEEHIINTIETKLSNARVEAINNKIKLFLRKAYGFRNIQNMLDMILLGCSNIFIPLPNRGGKGLKVA